MSFDPKAFIASTPKAGAFDPKAFISQTPKAETFRGKGASGDWGFPDPGPIQAFATKLNQGIAKDGSDELVGLLGATQNNAMPGGYLKLPDGTEVPVPTREALYRAGRDYERQSQEAADQHWPKLGFLAQMGGEVAGDAAIGGAKAVGRTYQTLSGLTRGLLGSNAELTPDKATPWTVGEAGLSSMFGGAVGNQAPVLMSRAAKSGAAKYLGGKLDDATTFAGEKLKNAAGWLKVNSLHPTPTGSEAMADLPGGTTAVGRELLERGIGGFTKKGTAEQIAAESGRAGAAIEELAKYHDAAGGTPINISGAISAGKARAQALMNEPTTETVGRQMMDLVEKYEAKFSQGSGTAEEILGMKRALGDAAYGEGQKLKRAGDKIAGKLGKGLSTFERATDDALDQALGPRFEAANLLSRRLRGATEAADRTAARAQGNGLVSLKTLLALGATGGAGLAGGLPAAATMAFGTKYGSQLGARSLYSLGSALQSRAPAAAQIAALAARGPAPARGGQSASSWLDGRLSDLIEPTYRPPLPAYAEGGDY